MVTFSNGANFLAPKKNPTVAATVQNIAPLAQQQFANLTQNNKGGNNTVKRAPRPWEANQGGSTNSQVRTIGQNPNIQAGQAAVDTANAGGPAPTGVYNPADLSASATAQSGAGATLLANGSPVDFGFDNIYNTALKNSNDLLAQNNDYQGKIQNFLQGSIDPTNGANVQSLLDRNAANRITDVNSLYSAGGQKMNDFQKAQAGLRNTAYQSGLFGSKEKASAEAQLGANLFRDRAGQIQAANELSRGETLGQLDKTRGANQSAAELYGNLTGQNLSASGNFLNSANTAASNKSSSDLGFRGLGADVLNQGMANQFQSSKYNTDLLQQDYQNQFANWQAINQATQQMYENAVGKKARQRALKMLQQQQADLKAMKAQQEGDGPNAWWDPLGTIT